MKSAAKNFVRRVRSKSPFRRRKRADTLVAEIRQKEEAYLKQLNAPEDRDRAPHGQPDDVAEIEVVLESSSLDFGGAKSQGNGSQGEKPYRKDEIIPDLAASSTGSTEDPPVYSAQAAARRFMERQQKLAAGNRRKSFRDRFMRPSKSSPIPPPPQPPSPARSTKQMGLLIRGCKSSGSSSTSTTTTNDMHTPPKALERGRSRERATRGAPSSLRASSKSSQQSGGSKRTGDPIKIIPAKEDPPPKPKPHFLFGSNSGHSSQSVTGMIEVGSQSRVSDLSAPAAIIRQESLGNESIRGVRQALQKMELELAAAGNAGKRVPRDKIMNALTFVANALHRDDQKEALVKELDAWIDESVMGDRGRRVVADEEDDDGSDDDETSYSDDCSSTFDLDAFDDGGSIGPHKSQQSQGSFPDLMNRLGKFFTISDEDKTAVKQALDDLLLSEFVSDKPARSRNGSRSTRHPDSDSDGDSIGEFDPTLACSIHVPKPEDDARGRSWWRRHGIAASGVMKKENLYPMADRAPSPESKLSVPSPTGKVNPRLLKPKPSVSSGSSKSSGRSRTQRQHQPAALKERPQVRHKVHEDSDTSVGWSSLDDSEFWRKGDRYTIPKHPKASTQQVKFANPHYKLAYSNTRRPEYDRFETEFLAPKEEDEFAEWDEACLHPPENVSHRRQAV
ncbi:expressed unknown protein [Seminavis robusta]|uniref:Uncharacterized protein n=1 Tax=Seminavis robusta TaxID=568900 RepID=A0A9N8E0M4_9STRA|nr:expressed unknown protein [Seminavis robusta]|eukprot:Sro530_g161130.1 n/a (675) ;mRNA; f:9977-12001